MSTLIRPLAPSVEFGLRLTFGRIPNSIGLLCAILLMSAMSFAQQDSTLSCYGRVNMSLSKSGVINLVPDHLTGRRDVSNLEVILPDRTNTQLDCRDLNQVIMVTLRNTVTGIVCMNEVYVEDKSPYEIVCSNKAVSCIDAIQPADFIEVIDNCTDLNDLIVGFTDRDGISFPDGSDTIKEIIRTWTTTDPTGIVRNCESSIYLLALDLNLIEFPKDTVVGCSVNPLDTAMTGGLNIDLNLLSANCGVAITTSIVGGPQRHSCGIKTKYFREWVASDWKSGTTKIETQAIIVEDTIKPRIIAPTSFVQVAKGCQVGIIFGAPTIESECSTFSTDNVEILFGTMSPKVGDTVIVDPGTYTIIYRGDGICPNVAEPDTAMVTISNLIAPTLACNDDLNKIISLNDLDSIPILLNEAFKSAAISSCGDFDILGRKVNSGAVFTPDLTLYLSEASQKLLIELIVRSSNGLYSDTCEVWIDVQEKVPPTLVLNRPIVETIEIGGSLTIDSAVIIASIGDNSGCIKSITYTGSGTLMPTGSGMPMMTGSLTWFTSGGIQQFDCSAVGTYLVKVAVTDCDDNMVMDTTTVVITDGGNCPMMATISGEVLAYGTTPIQGVSVSAYNGVDGYVATTDEEGQYYLDGIFNGGAYGIEVALADLWNQGLTAYDLSLLKHYVLGLEDLDVYQRASGDIDNSGRIDLQDVLALQKIVMRNEVTVAAEVKPWLFSNRIVDGELKPYERTDFNIDRPLRLDWKAVKRGDLDGDIILKAKTRSVAAVAISELSHTVEGYTYQIHFGDEDQVRAFQLSLDVSDLEIDVISHHDEILIDKNSDQLSMLYYNSDPLSEPVGSLTIVLQTSGPLDGRALGDQLAPGRWDNQGSFSNLNLEFSKKEMGENYSDDVLSVSAYPNPTSSGVDLSIHHVSSVDGTAVMTISDVMGRLIERRELQLSATDSDHTVQVSLPSQSGIYVISVQTIDNQRYVRVVKK